MSTAAEQHDDVDQAADVNPILAAIDDKIAQAEALAERYRRFRAIVEDALAINIDQLELDGLDLDGHKAPSPESVPAAASVAATPTAVGGSASTEEDRGARPEATRRAPADPAERQGGGLSKAKEAVRREGTADRKDRTKANERAEAAVKVIRKEPGLNGAAIAERLGLDQGTTSTVLNSLARQGRVRREKDGRSNRYYPPEQDLAKTDDDGCKTEVERKVLAAVKASSEAQTSDVIAREAGVRGNGIGEVLSGLARRGVLRRVQAEGFRGATRWEMAG